jgi:hypothetical protein
MGSIKFSAITEGEAIAMRAFEAVTAVMIEAISAAVAAAFEAMVAGREDVAATVVVADSLLAGRVRRNLRGSLEWPAPLCGPLRPIRLRDRIDKRIGQVTMRYGGGGLRCS